MGTLAEAFARAAIASSAVLTSFPMAKADDRGAARTHSDASRYEKQVPFALAPLSARLHNSRPVVDPRAPPTTGHDRADEVKRVNVTDAGGDDPKQVARIDNRIPRHDFLIVRAVNALALHSVVTRATEKRIVKGPVIVLTAMRYA